MHIAQTIYLRLCTNCAYAFDLDVDIEMEMDIEMEITIEMEIDMETEIENERQIEIETSIEIDMISALHHTPWNRAQCTLHLELRTLHLTPYTVHHAPCTVHPCTLHLAPRNRSRKRFGSEAHCKQHKSNVLLQSHQQLSRKPWC